MRPNPPAPEEPEVDTCTECCGVKFRAELEDRYSDACWCTCVSKPWVDPDDFMSEAVEQPIIDL